MAAARPIGLTPTGGAAVTGSLDLQPMHRVQQSERHPWFALYVKSRHEKSVGTALRQCGYEVLVPLYKRPNRSRIVDLPLFPNYVFCRLDFRTAPPLFRIPGVFEIVKQGNSPAPISEDEVTAIDLVVASGYPAMPWPNLKVGDAVRIDRGPLRGIQGTLDRASKQLVVSVALLQRSIAVTVPREWLAPASGIRAQTGEWDYPGPVEGCY
jgi:transcription antitermination factor NusG